jgi:hypothetical protein
LGDKPLSLAVEIPPQHGTVEVIFGPTSPHFVDKYSDAYVRYIPAVNFYGQDSFVYTVTDIDGDISTATVTVIVSSVNDAPLSMDDAYNLEEDSVLNVEAPGVLGNDNDVDGDPLITLLESDVIYGTLVLREDGSFTYTPDPGFIGMDSFTYKVSDGIELSDVATVTILVVY